MASKSAHAGTAIDLERGRKRLSSTLSPIDGTAPAKQLAKKRRSREAVSLGVTAHEERYLPETSTVWYAGQQRNRNPAVSKRKAANAAQDSWAAYREWQAECVTLDKDKNIHISIELDEEKLASSSSSPLSAGMAKARRYAILYVYTEVYGCAPENKWDDFDDNYGMRLPTIIMKHLMIPRGSYQAVITAMRGMYAAHENGETYDPSGNIMSGRERPGHGCFWLRAPRGRDGLQPLTCLRLPVRRQATDLRPGDAQGGVVPHE